MDVTQITVFGKEVPEHDIEHLIVHGFVQKTVFHMPNYPQSGVESAKAENIYVPLYRFSPKRLLQKIEEGEINIGIRNWNIMIKIVLEMVFLFQRDKKGINGLFGVMTLENFKISLYQTKVRLAGAIISTILHDRDEFPNEKFVVPPFGFTDMAAVRILGWHISEAKPEQQLIYINEENQGVFSAGKFLSLHDKKGTRIFFDKKHNVIVKVDHDVTSIFVGHGEGEFSQVNTQGFLKLFRKKRGYWFIDRLDNTFDDPTLNFTQDPISMSRQDALKQMGLDESIFEKGVKK